MTSQELWAAIASLARWAPTPHNTQPFRIRPRDGVTADLLLVAERLLSEEDHGNLYMASAFGVFASALEQAGRCVGRDLRVEAADVDPGALGKTSGTIVVGTARIGADRDRSPEAALFDARRTSRLPYHDRSIDPGTLVRLAGVARAGGHRMIVHGDAVVEPLLRMNAEAIIDNLQIANEREEIRGWYRMGATPEFGDGLWQHPMNQPAWELRAAFATPWAFQIPGLRQLAVARFMKTQAGTRHVALLCGPFARWPDLVAAGRMLFDLWLAMAAGRVYMQPFGSMLTNPSYASRVAKQFGVGDCWLVMRLGYSDPPPRSPRLESILVHE